MCLEVLARPDRLKQSHNSPRTISASRQSQNEFWLCPTVGSHGAPPPGAYTKQEGGSHPPFSRQRLPWPPPAPWSHVVNYERCFHQNYYTFTLISPIKIVLCSKFLSIQFMNYKCFDRRTSFLASTSVLAATSALISSANTYNLSTWFQPNSLHVHFNMTNQCHSV